MKTTHLSVEDGIAILRWENPPHNRLSSGVTGAFESAIEQIRGDKHIRSVVLTANGKDFSHGGDITTWPSVPADEMGRLLDRALQRANALERLPVPIVSAINGRCFGGGFEIALRTDVIVAERGATFRHTEQTLGVFTLIGGVQRVAERAGKARAMKWALTSEEVSAEEMLEAGVITEVTEPGNAFNRALEWARTLADGPTLAHAAHKQLLYAWATGGIAAADEQIPALAARVFGSEDAKKGIASAIDALKRGVERPVLTFAGK